VTGYHTSTASTPGCGAETKNQSKSPRGAFSTTPQISEISLLDNEFLNNSGGCSTAELGVSVLLTFYKKD